MIKADGKGGVMEVSLSKALVEAEREIESLRQECKDWAEEHNRIVLMLEQDRDEWKRRAEYLWISPIGEIKGVEADKVANWFEEE